MVNSDVVILGGGVIGLTTAYFLARAGVRVQVLDKGDLGQEASWAGAGILPPANLDFAKTPYDRLRAHSVLLHPQLAEELQARTGIDNGYLRSGGLEFSHDDGADDEWRSEGVEVQRLTAAEVRAKEPTLNADLCAAVFLPGMAQVRNPWHLRALIAACQSLNVDLHPQQTLHGFERRDGRIVAAQTSRGDVVGGSFVVAAGAWTDQLLESVGCRLGIHPVRGQIVLLNPGRPIVNHILLTGPRYLVPRGDGRILIGSTEENAGFNKSTTSEGVQGLLALAKEMVPALADAPVEKSWAGLRPASKDGVPYIGRVPGIANLLVAAGHFRAGIQLSPGTALMLKEMILGEPPTIPGGAFELDRATASVEA